MATLTIKNKREKISPGGLITLNVAARKALGMKVNEPARVTVTKVDKYVLISGKPGKKDKVWRVSPKGMLGLGGEAKELLLSGKVRHYKLELDDAKSEARLIPY